MQAPGQRLGRAWHAAKMSSVGIEMAVATAVGWGLGTWLDRTLDTKPVLMLVCLGLGVAAGFKGLFRAARELQASVESQPTKTETAAAKSTL